jgi:hypothetical protein
MKRVLLLVLLAIIAIPVFQSCKKGDNDPAISFKSRKARLCGEWNLKEGFSIDISSNGNIKTHTYDGTKVVITETGSPDDSYIFTIKVTINKDGTYKYESIYEDSETISEGIWYFGRANKDLDLKNKEIVHFVRNKYTYTNGTSNSSTGTESLENISTWQLDKLSSKELIVISGGSAALNNDSSTYHETMTYEKK